MSKFLDDFLLTMPEMQAQQLKNIYNKEASGLGALDKASITEALNRLRAQIDESKEFSFQGRPQSDKLDAVAHSKNLEEIDFDLRVLFTLSASIDEYMKDHLALGQSGLQLIEKRLYQIKQRMIQIAMRLNKNTKYDQVIYETMEAPTLIEGEPNELLTFGTDRFNEQVPTDSYAEHMGKTIVLAGTMSEDQVKTNFGRKLAEIEVRNQTGYASIMQGHEIDKAFDTSNETYWAENILMEEPIESTETTGWEIHSRYNGLTGALCEIQIRLDAVSTVSDIHFDPFCAYPLSIIDITGYSNRDFGGETYSLISRDHDNPNQMAQTSNKKMIFRFPSVEVGSIRITVQQENFTKESYIVKEDDITNMKMWNSISSDEELLDDVKNPNETMGEFNRKLEVSGWNTYLEALKSWSKDVKQEGLLSAAQMAINKIKSGNFKNGLSLQIQELKDAPDNSIPEELATKWVATNKTSYVYGAYNIAVYGRKYKQQSVFVSKPFNLSSNAKRITLDVEESQVVSYNNKDGHKEILTDIEYYLTAKKNPTYNEWIPVCPLNKGTIENEQLLGDAIGGDYPELKQNGRSIEFGLRFQAISKNDVVIRKNGEAIPSSHYIVSDDCRKVSILSSNYVATSSYTVSYKPVDSAYYFDTEEDLNMQPTLYINEQGQVGESFAQVELGSEVTLTNVPYLSRNFLFDKNRNDESYKQKENVLANVTIEYPVQVWADGKELMNVTSYDSNTYDPERLKENNGYTFAQIGKQVILGSPVDKKIIDKVKIDYHYIINNIRMKAILRRTTLENDSVTPELTAYTIQCINKDQEV